MLPSTFCDSYFVVIICCLRWTWCAVIQYQRNAACFLHPSLDDPCKRFDIKEYKRYIGLALSFGPLTWLFCSLAGHLLLLLPL